MTDKERMESMKWFNAARPLTRFEVDWLIKRIEELEKDIENYKKACASWETVESYSRKEAQRYKQTLEEIDNEMEYVLHYGFEGNDHIWRTRKQIEKALNQSK